MNTSERINDPLYNYNHLYTPTSDGIKRKDFRAYIVQTVALNRISIRQLAKDVNFDYHNLATYLRGKRGIPSDALERIFARLGM